MYYATYLRKINMSSENSKKKLSSRNMPRALRARQAFFAELFLAIFAEHDNFAASINIEYFSDFVCKKYKE